MRAQVIYNQENQKSINIDLLAGNKIGPQGLKGDSAYVVAKKNGFQGTEEQWLASLKGQTGDVGPQGQKGDKGDTGATGPQGQKGDKGDRGQKGDKGDTGIEGPQGPRGQIGPQGPKGDTGQQGPRGYSGEKGERGYPFTYEDFTQQQLEGLRGPQGIQGQQGPKGDKGDTGAQGPQGIEGPQGIQGPPGIQGETGPQGLKGDKGEKGQKGDKGDPGNLNFYICSSSEYDSETRKPTVSNPDGNTFYLVPAELETSPDLFVEWIYVNNKWEMFGSATVDLSDYITDVQIDGNSIVNNGVATIPQASAGVFGVISVNEYTSVTGLQKDPSGYLKTAKANSDTVKAGTNVYQVIVPSNQHESTFYGLAKAAGDNTQSASNNTVGQYTDDAKTAIKNMLDIAQGSLEITDPNEDGNIFFEQTGNLSNAGVIADIYSNLVTYNIGDYCIYGKRLYKCVSNISSGEAWNPNHWERINLTSEISDVKGDLNDLQEGGLVLKDGSLTLNKFKNGEIPFVTPELYGAKGDGITDDTIPVQNALRSGLTVYGLQGKKYYVKNTITGCKSSINGMIILLDVNKALSYSRLEDITIENTTFIQIGEMQDPDDRGNYAIGFSFCSNVTFDNCFFENFNGSIILNVTKDSSITNCKFDTAIQTATRGNGYGIVLQCCKNIVIANNVFKDVARHAIYISYSDAYEDDPSFSGFTKYCTDITVQNNIFKLENLITGYNKTTFEYQVKTISSKNVLISDNSFDNCYNAIWLSQTNGFPNSNIIIQGNNINTCIGSRACILALSTAGDVTNTNIVIDSNVFSSDNPAIKMALTDTLNVTNNMYKGASYLLFIRNEGNIGDEDTLFWNHVKISNNHCEGGIARFVGTEDMPLGKITNCTIENNNSTGNNAIFFNGAFMKFQYLHVIGNTITNSNAIIVYNGEHSEFDRVFVLNNLIFGKMDWSNTNSNLIYALRNTILILSGDYANQLITDFYDKYIIDTGIGSFTPSKGYNTHAVDFSRTLRTTPTEVILIPMASPYFADYVSTFIVQQGTMTNSRFIISYKYLSDNIVDINYRYIAVGQH